MLRAVEAARAAVVPEATDTVADAVKRAMASGNAGSGAVRGFDGLGGLRAQKQALKELVLLPLQVCVGLVPSRITFVRCCSARAGR